MKLSIVIPCHNEGDSVNLFYRELMHELHDIQQSMEKSFDWEIIFVNDGSKDNTLEEIEKLQQIDSKVGYIDFTRNFGKEAAILAGLKHSVGDAMVLMDADLQDPPSLLSQMIQVYQSGYDCVYTRRSNRKGEPPIRSMFAKLFYKIINAFSEVKIQEGTRDYRIMSRSFVNSYLENGEVNRFSKGLFSWVGYKTKCIEYENVDRVSGRTSWSFQNLFIYALDGIVSFSIAPLRIAIILGTMVSMAAFLFLAYIFVKTTIWGNPTSGWSSTISIVLFLGGIQLICTGILGEYIGRIFYEIKKRPTYLIKNAKLGQLDEMT